MGGLAAIFDRGGQPVATADMARMESALRLHGPARQGSWTGGAFGMAWSSSGDFSPQDRGERQPLQRADRWSIAFTGYLSHRDDLSRALDSALSDLSRTSDAELVLRAWEAWGEETAGHLHGVFAFVLVDRHERRLFAVRSALSAPPIFLFEDCDRLVIATAPKVIFALGDVPRELDEQRIADSLVHNHEDHEQSFYRHIRSLPLGSVLRASTGGVEQRRWTDFSNIAEIRLPRDEDYLEAAQELLDRAMASAMDTIELPCSTLSSGLDSSTIAVSALDVMARRPEWQGRRLKTFTSVPDPEWDGITEASSAVGDESGPVRALADMYPQLDPHFVDCAGVQFDSDLYQLTALSEAPIYSVKNLYWIVDINRHVKQAGANVVLTGVGGSTTITASRKSLPAMQLRKLALGDLAESIAAAPNDRGRLANFVTMAAYPNMPRWVQDTVDGLRGRTGDAEWNNVVPLTREYAGDMRVTERRGAMMRGPKLAGRRNPHAFTLLLAERGMRDATQPVRAALQSLTGLQARDPLADRKLFEFCLAIPPEQFFKAGQSRRLVRRMMADRLPREILQAPKARQAADWHVRLTRDLPSIRREVERMADDPDMAKRFDIPRIRRLLDTWPDKTPVSVEDHPDFELARMGLTRVLNTARFINWVKGKN